MRTRNTVEKLPMTFTTPKMRPLTDLMVRYEPSALFGTGERAAASCKSSHIRVGEPILSEVVKAVNMKTRMKTKRTMVWT